MRFAVIGTGGTGGYFGGRLAAHGHEVSFVARGEHLQALRRDGLTVESVAGGFSVHPVRATDDPSEIGAVDVVLFCVKTWQLPPVVAALAPLLGPGSAVMTLQNGVEAPAQVAEAVGRGAVLPGVAKIFASLDGPGRVSHGGGPASLTFAEWDGRPTERVDRLRAALTESAVAAVTPPDIWVELWSKFVFVVPLGGLGAATGAPIGVLRSRPGTRQLLAEAMGEIERVGRAHGIGLADEIVATTMGFLDQQPEGGTTSLQRDILAGRPSELDAWTGAVVRLGAQTATPTPIHTLLTEVLTLRGAH
jgi:2-dehydropantoate 2-reductase